MIDGVLGLFLDVVLWRGERSLWWPVLVVVGGVIAAVALLA